MMGSELQQVNWCGLTLGVLGLIGLIALWVWTVFESSFRCYQMSENKTVVWLMEKW